MYIKSIAIQNFRKFGDKDNCVYFVEPPTITKKTCQAEPDIQTPQSLSSISNSSTLIIGKNNSGKTTIAKAFKFICGSRTPRASDFNLKYLQKLYDSYFEAFKSDAERFELAKLPEICFTLEIGIDFSEEESDLINNLYQFVPISDDNPNSVKIFIKYQVAEAQNFKNSIKNIFVNQEEDDSAEKGYFDFYDLLNNTEKTKFIPAYFNSSGESVNKPAIDKLINIKEIEANRHLEDGSLSKVFKKIVTYHYTQSNDEKTKENLLSHISEMNKVINEAISPQQKKVSNVLGAIESVNHIQAKLSGNINLETVLSDLIRYYFDENGNYIPEEQFGLGYINLLNIIGEIIYYIDCYEDDCHHSSINLLFIEEPESFMHPQMQEFFINRIDDAITQALKTINTNEKRLYCQLAITTHSSHIVNSKVHSGNSFNNINYMSIVDGMTTCTKLSDELIVRLPKADEKPATQKKTKEETKKEEEKLAAEKKDAENSLKFIKKHIKYKASELFFSDAVIFVEGASEYTLLPYYLEKNAHLKNYYISVFNVDGAHAQLYFPLMKQLRIPCLVITDLDIKRAPSEKGAPGVDGSTYLQIVSLENRETTNNALKDTGIKLSDKLEYIKNNNTCIVFQKNKIEGYYAASFEEAFILSNHTNNILNSVLAELKPDIYKGVIGNEPKNYQKLLSESFKLQCKLATSKSEFANKILYQCVVADKEEDCPKIPEYIQDGFNWLQEKLQSTGTMNDNDK